MENARRHSLGDMLSDWIKETWYYSRLQQKLFGNIPELEEFIQLTQGEITLQSQLKLVAPLSASLYPFEIGIKYKAYQNGILVPVFSPQLKHYELVEKLTEDEYDALTNDELNKKLTFFAEHRKIKIQLLYDRTATVDFTQQK